MAKLATLKREDNLKQNKNTEGSIGPSGITNEQAAELGNIGSRTTEMLVHPLRRPGPGQAWQRHVMRFWGVAGGIKGVFTVIWMGNGENASSQLQSCE